MDERFTILNGLFFFPHRGKAAAFDEDREKKKAHCVRAHGAKILGGAKTTE